jgi:hypothetical protein
MGPRLYTVDHQSIGAKRAVGNHSASMRPRLYTVDHRCLGGVRSAMSTSASMRPRLYTVDHPYLHARRRGALRASMRPRLYTVDHHVPCGGGDARPGASMRPRLYTVDHLPTSRVGQIQRLGDRFASARQTEDTPHSLRHGNPMPKKRKLLIVKELHRASSPGLQRTTEPLATIRRVPNGFGQSPVCALS